jgi:hypothetical protein
MVGCAMPDTAANNPNDAIIIFFIIKTVFNCLAQMYDFITKKAILPTLISIETLQPVSTAQTLTSGNALRGNGKWRIGSYINLEIIKIMELCKSLNSVG